MAVGVGVRRYGEVYAKSDKHGFRSRRADPPHRKARDEIVDAVAVPRRDRPGRVWKMPTSRIAEPGAPRR